MDMDPLMNGKSGTDYIRGDPREGVLLSRCLGTGVEGSWFLEEKSRTQTDHRLPRKLLDNRLTRTTPGPTPEEGVVGQGPVTRR